MLSLPDRDSGVDQAVAEMWDDLQIVDGAAALAIIKRKLAVAERLALFGDEEILDAVGRRRAGGGGEERPVKQVELDALRAAPEGFGDDVPVDLNSTRAGCRTELGGGRRTPARRASRRSSKCTGCARSRRSPASPASRR